MRTLAAGLMLSLAAGCRPDCGLPQQLDGLEFQVFGNVTDWTMGDSGPPPGNIPINGYTDWQFEWGAVPNGPIVVRINGQPFDGEGSWNDVECGNFTASFGGTFRADDGSDHNFTTAGNFYYYDVLLEGAMAYNETWTSADGSSIGQLQVVDGAISGRQYAPE